MTACQKRATGKCVFENKPERNMDFPLLELFWAIIELHTVRSILKEKLIIYAQT